MTNYKPTAKLILFPNDNAGKPIKKKDGSFVLTKDGKNVTHGLFNGKIDLPEGLAAGEYEVSVYENVSKAGKKYLSGSIKAPWKKPVAKDAPSQNSVDNFNDDSVPF